MYYKKYGHVVIASTVWTYLSKNVRKYTSGFIHE